MSNLKRSAIPNSSSEVRETNLQSNNEFLRNLGFINSSSSPKETRRRTRNYEENVEKNEKTMNVRKSSRLVAEAEEKKRKEEESQGGNDKSVCPYCFDQYQDGRTYDTFRGLFRHQNSANCARNKSEAAESKLIVTKESVVMSNRSKHLSNNFETRKVFSTENANLNIVQPFNDVISGDDVNMESLPPQPNLIVQLTKERNALDFVEYEASLDVVENQNMEIMDNEVPFMGYNKYIEFQEKLYDFSYGKRCLAATNFAQMIKIMRDYYWDKFDSKLMKKINLYNHWNTFHCSVREQEALLELLHKTFLNASQSDSFPRSIVGVKNKIESFLKVYNFDTIHVEWPRAWRMHMLNSIEPILLFQRDPMYSISELLINPEIMYKYKDHVRFQYHESLDEDGNLKYTDLMSSKWLKETEIMVKNIDKDGIPCPIIFYSDGVQLNDISGNNVKPVMCTIGNFSDELIEQDVSKCIIGYLPTFKRNNRRIFEDHLKKVYPNQSKSFILNQIHHFDLLVEREYWRKIMEDIKRHWDSGGVRVHVLGHGMKLLFPCVAFFVGDDPQQHRQAGLQEGNCLHGCTYCTYSYKDGLYNDVIHLPRNYADIFVKCSLAERTSEKQRRGELVSKVEEENLSELRYFNMHPFRNPAFDAPMGHDNNIFIATPPDTLHNFCAGLMKSLVKFILTIAHNLGKIQEFSTVASRLEERVIDFCYVHDMPHVNWTKFKDGVMQYVQTSKQEQGRATGSFGGFRSNSFISLLIQIYYSIGFDDYILPGPRKKVIWTYKNGDMIELVDIRGRISRSIESVLDVYFDVKRSEWIEDDVVNFDQKLKNLYTHYMLVWDLNQVLIADQLRENYTPCKQRNPHKIFHLPLIIRKFGSLLKCCTSRWEAYHKVATTGVYETTSKRHNNLCLEMLNKFHLLNISKHLNIISQIHQDEDAVKKRMRNINRCNQNVRYFIINKYKKHQFRLKYGEINAPNHFVLDDEWNTICVYEPMNTVKKFLDMVYKLDLLNVVKDDIGIQWDNVVDMCEYYTYFIGAIKFISDPKSIGSGKLYATTKHNHTDLRHLENKSRYDYVLVSIALDDVNGTEDDEVSLNDGIKRGDKVMEKRLVKTILVKLLLFMCLQKIGGDEHELDMYCVVQEMYEIKNNRRKCNQPASTRGQLGKAFKWAADPNNDRLFKYHIIPVDSIVRPVFVIPELSEQYVYNDNKPNARNVFYVIDRPYFDRSGWRNNIHDRMENFVGNVSEQREYLNAHNLGNILMEPNRYVSNLPQEHIRDGDSAITSSDQDDDY